LVALKNQLNSSINHWLRFLGPLQYFDNRNFQIHLILISFFSFISLWALGEKMNEGVQSQEEWDQKQKERRRSEELERQLSSEIRRL